MARIYEYQGKSVLKKFGVPVPKGDIALSGQEAKEITQKINNPVVIKAQIWTTGRFKLGGIKFADTPEEAEKVANELLGKTINGLLIEKVLVEEKLDIEREFYIGVIVDSSTKVKAPVLVFSTEGDDTIKAK